eukprot:TRINITY_DN13996_c0_g4_i1.p1 TRINITY_DN13996_c0_g4~~TRINITY_DN13996_c0_g4_i1.p1  ORF type:complete len:496 (-),score=51.60 TRINITY_DN13996_c0_g4_i1:43-1530(-)
MSSSHMVPPGRWYMRCSLSFLLIGILYGSVRCSRYGAETKYNFESETVHSAFQAARQAVYTKRSSGLDAIPKGAKNYVKDLGGKCVLVLPANLNRALADVANAERLVDASGGPTYVDLISDPMLEHFPQEQVDAGASRSGADFWALGRDAMFFLKLEQDRMSHDSDFDSFKRVPAGKDYGPVWAALQQKKTVFFQAYRDRLLQRPPFENSGPSFLQHFLLAYKVKCRNWGKWHVAYFVFFSSADPLLRRSYITDRQGKTPQARLLHKYDLKPSRQIPERCQHDKYKKNVAPKDGYLGDYLAFREYVETVKHGERVASTGKLIFWDGTNIPIEDRLPGLQADLALLAAYHLIDYSLFLSVRLAPVSLLYDRHVGGESSYAIVATVGVIDPLKFKTTMGAQQKAGQTLVTGWSKFHNYPVAFYCLSSYAIMLNEGGPAGNRTSDADGYTLLGAEHFHDLQIRCNQLSQEESAAQRLKDCKKEGEKAQGKYLPIDPDR